MTEQDQIRVMIVDDHFMVRDGLKTLLDLNPDFVVSGVAGSAEEAIQLCKHNPTDVVLMDLCLPEMDGISATRVIRAADPNTEVLILSNYMEGQFVCDALEAGAMGYLLKGASPEELTRAIRAANCKSIILDTASSAALVEISLTPKHAGYDELSDRELEILALAAEGMRNKAIGKKLTISPATVNFHMGNIFSKLNVSNRMEAVRVAVDQKLIS